MKPKWHGKGGHKDSWDPLQIASPPQIVQRPVGVVQKPTPQVNRCVNCLNVFLYNCVSVFFYISLFIFVTISIFETLFLFLFLYILILFVPTFMLYNYTVHIFNKVNQATNSGPSQTQQQQAQVRGLEPVTTAAAATAQPQQQPARGMEQINSHYQQQQQQV